MTERSELRVMHGAADIIETLEDLLAKARAGDVTMLIAAHVDSEHVQKWAWAHKDDQAFAWARMVAMVAGIQHDLMQGGL